MRVTRRRRDGSVVGPRGRSRGSARGRRTRRLTRPLTRRVARPRRRRQKPARFGGRARDRRVPALDVLRGARIGVVANAGDEIVVRREFDGPSSRGPRIGSGVPRAGPPGGGRGEGTRLRRRARRKRGLRAEEPAGTRAGRKRRRRAGGGRGVPKRRRRRRRRARVAGDAVRGPARRGDASRAWGRRTARRRRCGHLARRRDAVRRRRRRVSRGPAARTRAPRVPERNPLRMLLVLDGGEPLLLGAALRRGHGGC